MSLLAASSVPKSSDAGGAVQPCGHPSSDSTCQHGSALLWLSADLGPLPGSMWVGVLSGADAGTVAMPGIDRSRKPDLNLEESVCLSGLGSARNPIPNQHESKAFVCPMP